MSEYDRKMWTVHRTSLSLIAATLIVGIAEEINRLGMFPPLVMRVTAVVLLVSTAIYLLTAKRKTTSLDPRDAYPAIDEVFREDWSDPKMAEYDDYEARKP